MSTLPYYAVIFTSIRTDIEEGYHETNELLMKKAEQYEGFMHQDAVRDGLGIAVSYWRDLDSIHAWRKDMDHIIAKDRGKKEWYKEYSVRIAKVEREYGVDHEISP